MLFSSCGIIASFKVQNAFEQETISEKGFKEELSFQEINGVLIIQVEFAGILRDFIFDTGATTKLDDDFAASLRVEKLGKVKTLDSNNNKEYIPYVKLDEFKIGAVYFYDVVASVSDIESLNKAACTDVVGIIGANAMNKGIWQIDYQNKKIIFTDERGRLNIPEKLRPIQFTAVGKGTPTIPLYFNNIYRGEAIFDTGSNGQLSMDEKYLPDAADFIQAEVYSFGVFSEKQNNLKVASIPSIGLDRGFVLEDQLVSFRRNQSMGIIGNKFLRNYLVTIDWNFNQILLEPYQDNTTTKNQDFGFYPRFINEKVVVGSIRMNSPAYKQGLRLNDRIITINNLNFQESTYDQYCEYLAIRANWDHVVLVVEKEGVQIKFDLERSHILETID
ncbi:MAG: hypothetical protein Sapg2KO_48930 [Saprospiraceae bacterium]